MSLSQEGSCPQTHWPCEVGAGRHRDSIGSRGSVSLASRSSLLWVSRGEERSSASPRGEPRKEPQAEATFLDYCAPSQRFVSLIALISFFPPLISFLLLLTLNFLHKLSLKYSNTFTGSYGKGGLT